MLTTLKLGTFTQINMVKGVIREWMMAEEEPGWAYKVNNSVIVETE